MKVSYFHDSDALYIEFRDTDIIQPRSLDENTVLDLYTNDHVCAITFEHASQHADINHLIVEGIAA